MTGSDPHCSACLRIGEWHLDPSTHQLSRDGSRFRLPKRLVRLLQELAREPGSTLSRQALLDRVWQRRAVADEVLSRSIAELRQMLEDDARSPRYIETIPKTGYRLIASVTHEAGQDSVAPASAEPESTSTMTAAATRRRPRRMSLAVIAGCLLAVAAAAAWFEWKGQTSAAAARWSAAAMVAEQPFLSEADWTLQPRFSVDGHWLVHLRISPGDGARQVLLGPAEGGASRVIVTGDGWVSGPALSPDSTQLAFLARLDGRCELRVVQLPAGAPQRIADCDPDRGESVEWTPDGALIFTAPPSQDGGSGLVQLDPATGRRQPLTQPSRAQSADVLPRLSVDGRLAFARGPGQHQTVHLLEHGKERTLRADENRIPGLAWTPDGSQLLVASNAPGYPALLAVDPASGDYQLLGARGCGGLDVAADGTLLYEQRRYDANLWQLSAQSARPLTDSTRFDALPALSASGAALAYISNRDGSGSVWLQDLDTGQERRLPLPAATAWTRPSWRLDGRSLILTRYDSDGGTRLVEIDVVDGRPREPVEGAAFGGIEAGDGSLVYGRHHVDGLQLWRQSPGQTATAIVGAARVGEFRVAGRWIGYQQRGQPGIVIEAIDGSSRQRILEQFGPGEPQLWQLSGDTLIYYDNTSGQPQLMRVELDSGQASAWLDAPGQVTGFTLAVDLAADRAVISRIDRLEIDLLRVPAPK